MMNKPPPFKGRLIGIIRDIRRNRDYIGIMENNRIPITIPIKERGVINQGSKLGLGFRVQHHIEKPASETSGRQKPSS